ncbi:MAG TPA: HIT domain-containing protein [Candidatus Paceibacterota bacterium]
MKEKDKKSKKKTIEENRYINMRTIRRVDQRKVMEKIKKAGHCPFCRENLDKYHKNPILKEGKYWLLTDNQWPYEKIKHQMLAIYKTHVEHLKDIDPEAGKELFEMFGQISKERGMSGGGVAMRFGSSLHGNYGSSVLHIHAHLIEPDLEKLNSDEAWRFKFGQPKNYKKS